MLNFEKNRKSSFMEKRKKELENSGAGMEMEDFTSPMNQPVRKPEENESPSLPEENKTEKPAPKPSRESDKGREEAEKKKTIIRKTIAIEEDVFMQLQLLKAYHRLDHQDVIAVAVKEFLKRHTENGRIKETDIKSITKMVDELKK